VQNGGCRGSDVPAVPTRFRLVVAGLQVYHPRHRDLEEDYSIITENGETYVVIARSGMVGMTLAL